ncbi:MAG: alpha/beta hydrolase [Firmicutes bacterium]|nr:alpha/beta hydrolase [Bacillota bacterium]
MIEVKQIASKKMLKTISMFMLIRKLSKKTLFWFTSRKPQVFVLPKRKMYRKNQIEVAEFKGLKTVTFKAKSPSNTHIIYLHGGAYRLKGKQNHYEFISDLNQKLRGTISLIDYPTNEESKMANTVSKTKEAIKAIMIQYPKQSFYLVGDSAGGGLALVIYKLLQQEDKQIIKLFLMSPWVDATMSNPLIDQLEEHEFMFTKEELLLEAIQYAGEAELNHLHLSPLYDDGFDLENIIIYAGNRDLLFPDIRKFAEINPKITLYEYALLPHVFPLFPKGVERKEVIQDIVQKIKRNVL